MSADRRTTFRAPLAGTREALLVSGGRSLRVRILDESSGGLCVASMRSCPFPVGTVLRLSTDDGDVLGVQIMHQRRDQRRFVLGLQRVAEPLPRRRESRGTRPLILLAGLTIGLYAGLAMRVETIRDTLAHVPPLSKLIFRN